LEQRLLVPLQAVVQLPQCEASVIKLLQIPETHSPEPGAQLQTLFWQVLPLEHTLPQVPQLALSVAAAVHIVTPLNGQAICPVAQEVVCCGVPLLQPMVAAITNAIPQRRSLMDAIFPMVLFGG
jgi:hypothetical protein